MRNLLTRWLFRRELSRIDLYERTLRAIASLNEVKGTDSTGMVHDAAALAANTLNAATYE